jgi:hypothetical protein
MKLEKKSMKKISIKKQSTNKTKWGYQNLWVVSCRQDNSIEEKTYKKTKFNFKKNQILKDKIKKNKKKRFLKKPRSLG